MLTTHRHWRPIVPFFALLALLSACGTPEYQAERKYCEAEWMLKIPPVYRQQLVNRTRSEERPSGETICKTRDGKTRCKPVMTRIQVPYTEIETVDIRRTERTPQIEACTMRACTAKYGNSQCET